VTSPLDLLNEVLRLEDTASHPVTSPLDVLNLAVHAAMISRGFVPHEPLEWTAMSATTCYCHSFKHPMSSNVFLIKAVPLESDMFIVATTTSGKDEPIQFMFKVSTLFNIEALSRGGTNKSAWLKDVNTIFQSVHQNIAKKLVPLQDDTPMYAPATSRDPRSYTAPHLTYQPRYYPQGPGAVFPPRVGDGDLGPFANGGRGPAGSFPGQGGSVGGGNLMGPNAFRPGGNSNRNFPQPRFDPYGPDTSGPGFVGGGGFGGGGGFMPGGMQGDPDNDMHPTFPTHGARFGGGGSSGGFGGGGGGYI